MFGRKRGELSIPRGVLDPGAVEALRVWETPGSDLTVLLRPEAFAQSGAVDAGRWGIALVDIARHVANAYQQAFGADPNEVLGRIRELFDAEWSSPTDTPQGGIHQT